MINEDEKYRSLRDTLKSLPRVNAKKDFEKRLFQRIKEAQNVPEQHSVLNVKKEPLLKGWLANLFRPAFAPALGLTAVLLITVVVYFAFFSKMNDLAETDNMPFVNSTNQGDLIIYVKNEDTGAYSRNYPKEYSAVSPDESGTERFFAPTETPTDFMSRPESPKPIDGLIKPDRVSEEQKIEMEKLDEKTRGVDVKPERKSEDDMMKKDSKIDSKRDSRKEGKTKSEESPYNIRGENKNEQAPNIQIEDSEEAQGPSIEAKGNEPSKKDSSKLGKSVKDSVKTNDRKTDTDEDEGGLNKQEENKVDPAIEQK
jgi:hypothetical protein